MKVLGLIPARGGSKGVERKNIKLLGGKPLIVYSIESALKCKGIDKIVVSTDDKEIAEIAMQNGAEVPFLRPRSLARDDSPSIDFILHALEELKGEGFDALCLLQPTYPFRALADIERALLDFQKSGKDTLITMTRLPHKYHPDWVYLDNGKGGVSLINGASEPTTRRQNLSTAFIRDGAIYLSKVTSILERRSLYGKSVIPFEMKESIDVNIDTPEDWLKAEELLREYHG